MTSHNKAVTIICVALIAGVVAINALMFAGTRPPCPCEVAK